MEAQVEELATRIGSVVAGIEFEGQEGIILFLEINYLIFFKQTVILILLSAFLLIQVFFCYRLTIFIINNFEIIIKLIPIKFH